MSAKTRPSSAGRSKTGTSSTSKSGASSKAVKSLPEFLVYLETDLLPRLTTEEDPIKRKNIGSTLKTQLNGLNTAIRARKMAREQNRREVYKRIGDTYAPKSFAGDLLSSNGFSDWQAHEHSEDERVLEALNKYIHTQEVDNQSLRESLDRRQNVENKLFPAKSAPDTSALKRRASQIDRIAMLEGLIKKQDADISVLQNQIEEQAMKYVLLPKEEYLELDRKIQPLIKARRMSNLGNNVNNGGLSRQTSSRTMADGLRNDVTNLIDQITRLRSRVSQTTDTITDQEKDKKVSMEILQHDHNGVKLPEVIAHRVDEWEEEKHDMESEIKSLRHNIESLAIQNRNLMESLNKHEEDKEKREKEARERRKSMPTAMTAEAGIKKAAEKRERRTTVANGFSPRISAVQLTLDSNQLDHSNMRPKSRPSLSARGPLRAVKH